MTRQIIASVMGVLGTLFFLAMAFNILPSNIGTFLGIACYVIVGAVWSIGWNRNRRGE